MPFHDSLNSKTLKNVEIKTPSQGVNTDDLSAKMPKKNIVNPQRCGFLCLLVYTLQTGGHDPEM